MTCSKLPTCCEYYADKLPSGCNEGRWCPARATQSIQQETDMAHVVTSKPSHQRTPRMERDAQFIWPAGAAEGYGMKWKPTSTDLWGIAMMAVAVVGALAVIVTAIVKPMLS